MVNPRQLCLDRRSIHTVILPRPSCSLHARRSRRRRHDVRSGAGFALARGLQRASRRCSSEWRAVGVTDLQAPFSPPIPSACGSARSASASSRSTARRWRCSSARDLDHLDRQSRPGVPRRHFSSHIEELAQLWDGLTDFSSHTVNYTLDGDRLDIQLSATILPGHEEDWDRVLIAIEDVTERETARRRLVTQRELRRGLFEHSPVSLWVEDFSAVKRLLDDVRERGIEDFRVFTDVHPRICAALHERDPRASTSTSTRWTCSARPTSRPCCATLGSVFRDDMEPHFREQLIDLWDGKLFQQREVVNYALDGTELHLLLQFSVLPGHERDWSLVQVALTDITARKKAEAYLEYPRQARRADASSTTAPSTSTSSTGWSARGRSPVTHHRRRPQRAENGQRPVGPCRRRRAAAARRRSARPSWSTSRPRAARIGGDEFAVLLPGIDAARGEACSTSLDQLVALNNQFYPGHELSLSDRHRHQPPRRPPGAGRQARRPEDAACEAAVSSASEPRPARNGGGLRRFAPLHLAPLAGRGRIASQMRSG